MAVEATVTFQDRRVQQALQQLRLGLPLGGKATPAFQGMGRVLLSGIQMRFRKGEAPDGSSWKKSRRVLEHGGQTLRDKGILRNSFSYVATNSSVTVGTNVIYAAIHHFGGVIKAKTAGGLVFPVGGGGWVRVQSVRIPARPILGASKSDIEGLLESLQGHIEGRWGGKK
jgi:phage gpG-like protein